MNMICGIDMHDMHLLENREKIQLYETIIYAKLYQTITFAKKTCGKFLTTWTGPAKKSAHDVNNAIYGWSHTLAAAGKVYISSYELWVIP